MGKLQISGVITMSRSAAVPLRKAGPGFGSGAGGGGGTTFGSSTSARSVAPFALTATWTCPPAFRAERYVTAN